MEYREAVKEAENQIDMYESMILYNKDFEPKNDNSNYENKIDSLKTAISAMEELREYKMKLNETYGECDDLLKTVVDGLVRHKGIDIGKPIKSRILTDEHVDLWEEYQKLGTLDEVQTAVEKQKAKKPVLVMNEVSGMFIDYADGHGGYRTQMNNWWHCPCCNGVVGQRVIVHKHHHDQRKKKYCEKCGQRIDWRDTYETD